MIRARITINLQLDLQVVQEEEAVPSYLKKLLIIGKNYQNKIRIYRHKWQRNLVNVKKLMLHINKKTIFKGMLKSLII